MVSCWWLLGDCPGYDVVVLSESSMVMINSVMG